MSLTPDSIKERVHAAMDAGELDGDFLREYLNQLFTAWRETSKSMVRTVILMILAMVLFGLLAGRAVSEISIASFKISNFGLLQLVIPVFVACLLLRLYVLGIDHRINWAVYDAIIARKYPELYKRDLEILIAPPGTGPIFDSSKVGFLKSDRGASVLSIFDSVQDILVGIVPLLFTVVAYIYLFNSLGASHVLVWASLLTTATVLLMTFAFGAAAKPS